MFVSNIVPRISKLEIASSDDNAKLINLWLHNKAQTTQDTYRRDVAWFLAFVSDRPLHLVTLEDLQAFHQALIEKGLAYNTQRRRLMAVKSWSPHRRTAGRLRQAVRVSGGDPDAPCSYHERSRYAADDSRLLRPTTQSAHSADALCHGC